MKMVILSGGPDTNLPNLLDPFFADACWVGVDRGTITLLKNGLVPVKAFGDFDSISDLEFKQIQNASILLSTYQAEKDATDLELALDWVLEQQPEACYLLGATGGRLDHALMNVQLLYKGIGHQTNIYLMDQQNIVTLLAPGSYNIGKRPGFHYVSFIAYTPDVLGLTLKGFKYPLEDHHLMWGSSLCISNQFEKHNGTVSFKEGFLLLVQSRD